MAGDMWQYPPGFLSRLVLMIFFCRIIVFQWSDFDCKYLMTTAFQFHDTFYDSLHLCIGIVDASLILCSGIITLFVETVGSIT